jgi:hypothetical protein
MDILLTMIKEDIISQEMKTVYIYTKRICIEEHGVEGNKEQQESFFMKQKL